MAVGAFKVVGQDSSIGATLPVAIGITGAQAGLAAGVEATPTVNFSRPVIADGSGTDVLIWLTAIPASTEANVMYVAEMSPLSPGVNNFATIKVKNVGSAAGASTWRVAILAIPVGVA